MAAGIAMLLALASAWPVIGLAQYMYLDSDGDGIHTAADQLNPSGPTTVDVWLDTDSNRDGTSVICGDPSTSVDAFSYSFILRAVDGSVHWAGFVNRFPDAGVHFDEQTSSTEYCNGYGGSRQVGLTRLASLTITVATGTPSIQIVSASTTLPRPANAFTLFGSYCLSPSYDNSWYLGVDWSDVDGLPYGTPMANHPPVLIQPAAMTAPVGSVVEQALMATDSDGQPVTFSKASGPDFMWVEMTDSGRGTATATTFLAPIYSQVGTWSASVEATDGVRTDRKSFDITVTPVPNRAPAPAPAGGVVVVAGTVARQFLSATDADGQPIAFSRVSGPDWALVETLNSGRGAATGGLRLTPTAHESGIASVVVSASDGAARTDWTIEVDVLAPQPPPPIAVLPWPNTGGADVALGDLNGDGKPDLVTGQIHQYVAVSLGGGDGSFGPPLQVDLGAPVYAVAVGDINGDGNLDVAAATDITNRLAVLLGSGDGALSIGSYYSIGAMPQRVVLRDLNGDSVLDVAVANSGSGTLSVLLGRGDGSFVPGRAVAVGPYPLDIAVADFDADGRLDLATANLSGHSVTLLFGRGDGTFGRRTDIPVGGPTDFVVAADFNWDGIPDFATNCGPCGVRAWIGAGDGSFTPAAAVPRVLYLGRAASTDWNADGYMDLVVTDSDRSEVVVLYGAGDGTFPTTAVLGRGEFSLALGDLNHDGFPDAAAGSGSIVLNQSSPLMTVQARVFLENPKRAVSIAPYGPDLCVRLEPVDGSYSSFQIDISSVTLFSEGTGPVDRIHALANGGVVESDADGNGIADIPVCFAAADLNRLFGGIRSRRTLTVRLEGGLVSGQHWSAPLELTVVGVGKSPVVSITPNPLNPSGVVRVTTSSDGYLRVRLYDLHGRLVRTIADQPATLAGSHEFRLEADGRLGSGVFFLRVDTPEGTRRTRIAVLK